jgi:ribose 5-phosphate isomerase B
VSETVSARLARAHNDANVLCLGGRIVGEEVALAAVREFSATPWEGGRHAPRLAKVAALEAEACGGGEGA